MPFRADVSAFLAKYTNIQRTSFFTPTSGAPFTGISNGPKATDLRRPVGDRLLKPTHEITPRPANYGFLHTGFDQGAPGFPTLGNTFGYSPEHSVNLSGNWHHDLAQGGAVVGTLSYAYQELVITFEDVQGRPAARLRQPAATASSTAASAGNR